MKANKKIPKKRKMKANERIQSKTRRDIKYCGKCKDAFRNMSF